MSEYGGINMQLGNGSKNGAKRMDIHQGGNKESPRPGNNKGIVDHHEVDKINHAKHASKAKFAMSGEGHSNVTYYDGGMKG